MRIFNVKEEREAIEWTNTWWSEANTDNRRGLLIGDSTTRQLRGSIEVLLTNSYAVDLFAASFSIHDKRLSDWISLLFKDNEYQYDFIVLNYGGHHGFSRLCSGSLEEYEAYRENYTELLEYLLKRCEKVICVTGTSEVLDTEIGTIDQDIEQEIIVRNRIVREAADANCVDMFDLYSLMRDKMDVFTYVDRQHFNRSADYFISYHLVGFLLSRKCISEELINRQREKGRKKMIEDWGDDRKYMIYGAGSVGIGLYWILKWYGLDNNICCFVVSTQMTQESAFQKPVVSIAELSLEACETSVLIIASDQYRDEMYKKAVESGVKHIAFYSDIVNGLSRQ